MVPAYLSFWGKAQPCDGTGPQWHPIAWHGLDVAASFAELLAAWPQQREAVAEAFEIRDPSVFQTLLTLVAIHDIGKFARGFQAKVAALYPACLGAWSPLASIDHADAGLALMEDDAFAERVKKLLGEHNDEERAFLLRPALGHHGRPVAGDIDIRSHFAPVSRLAAFAFFDDVRQIFPADPLPRLRKGAAAGLSWRLAGLIALADWIGSNQDFFGYVEPDIGAADYWREFAVPRAKEAIRQSGLSPALISSSRSVDIVVPAQFRSALTDAQTWASETPLPARSGLFVLEDVMGSGKTEAALILAHRLMRAGQADGLYVALPTMATANALFERLGAFYRRLFADDAEPSLILSHSARDLHEGFRSGLGLETAGRLETAYGADAQDETASAACARWFADDRRKTFLAHVGVGTVDQALLAVLPVKHAAVRQLGLTRKVLIIDEAHAYDAYMQAEIEKLVELQAMAGAPVIILSATLPMKTRRKLSGAHAKGVGRTAPDLSSQAYPLATSIGDRAAETPLMTRVDLARNLAIGRCADPATAEKMIVAAARDGATVAYIRNAVDDAIETAQRLREAGVAADLFHARFAMHDRMRIETDALTFFGRAGSREQRRCRVLVATQVVEQSLDLDFDLMFTDLAPIDLMLQRAGRVWRHSRTGRGWPAPTLNIVSPDPIEDPAADWFAAAFPRGRAVYPDHALLWRSAREIFAAPSAALPGDIRRLVETVYDEDLLTTAPAALRGSAVEAMGKDAAARTQAKLNVLSLEHGYALDGGAWSPDIETPTRLTPPRQRLRLARAEQGRLVPWAPVANGNVAKAWALSEVAVGKGWFSQRAVLPDGVEAMAQALDREWAEKRVDAAALPLFCKDGVWSSEILDGRKQALTLLYSPALGLRRSDRL